MFLASSKLSARFYEDTRVVSCEHVSRQLCVYLALYVLRSVLRDNSHRERNRCVKKLYSFWWNDRTSVRSHLHQIDRKVTVFFRVQLKGDSICKFKTICHIFQVTREIIDSRITRIVQIFSQKFDRLITFLYFLRFYKTRLHYVK